MSGAFERALAFVLSHEGGWADDPRDPGGATMRGITIATYTVWRERQGLPRPGKDDLRAISDDEIAAIYRAGYWDACRCDDLPAGIALLVFDMAVNAGPGRGAELLQISVGVKADRSIGPQTIAATARAYAQGPSALIIEYSARRAVHYGNLPHFTTYGLGWTRRLCAAQAEAIRLAGREALLMERGDKLLPTFKE